MTIASMAALACCSAPCAARQPPACACQASSSTCMPAVAPLRRGATPLTAAACPIAPQRLAHRRSHVAFADKSRVRTEFEKGIAEEDAAVEAEAEPSMEQQLQMLRAQGPPPGMSQEDFKKQMDMYEKAMQDPQARKRMQDMQAAAAQPQVQQQMAQMEAVMQNKDLMNRMAQLKGDEMLERMAEMREDPEFKSFFEAVQSGGMGVLQQYMGNPEFLAKLGERIGDIDLSLPGENRPAAQPGAAVPAGAPPPPDIENLLQAAKYGDLEATEDLLAVGHDASATDAEKRTPLHYAVAYRHMPVAEELLKAGADLEACDSKGNTPLHYAAGYGRGEFVTRLLEAGAPGNIKNDSNHTPYELVSMEQQNPLNHETETLELLKGAAGAA